ncbi:NUDIX hydrolase domain-like protein [Phyllosticta citribraziliensis]
MAESQDVPNHLSRSLTAKQFVESSGVVLFNKSRDQVCIMLHQGDCWVLPKGRRNCGETRQAAALRETKEETGHTCRLLPVRMSTRAPPANEDDTSLPDEARQMNDLTEPFELSLRGLGKAGIKLVWWFIAVVDEAEPPSAGEAMFQPRFLPCHEAMERLTFQGDRETLAEAIEIVEQQ